MLVTRWQGWVVAMGVTLVTAGLVIGDLTDTAFRHWWSDHALTTDTVSGLLVLLITFLIVNQVVRLRQIKDRARAVAAQAAIVVGQAARSSRAVSAALDGSGDRDAASDEVRTYMMMLMVGAPVLIDARASRNFLEQAQHLGAEMARTALAMGRSPGPPASSRARLDDAVQQLRAASAPLLQQLSLEQRTAASGDEAGSSS
jgi:hypothetical protein